ncbi:unnamed protein product [Peniophora sp. CBMAI 1063]|nr:unnamed protein product [Peniophora sp. CBMAI 1063]
MVPVEQLIKARLHGSILVAAFGFNFAYKRTLAHASRAWLEESASAPNGTWGSFEDFVDASYSDLLESDGKPKGLISISIPFYAWATFKFGFGAYAFQASSAGWWYLMDMKTEDTRLIIPLKIFEPYNLKPGVRQENVMKEVDLRPLWCICRDGTLGVPVIGELPELCRGNEAFERADGSPRKTMKVKINWPGYAPSDKQIRPLSDKGDRSIKRLMTLVAGKVCAFLDEHATACTAKMGTEAAYVIGTQTGEISSRDVLLLGIVIVSEGAATPILRLRDDFLSQGLV